jgi:hypothetical protein
MKREAIKKKIKCIYTGLCESLRDAKGQRIKTDCKKKEKKNIKKLML